MQAKIVTLCGSTRFKDDFIRVTAEETLKGNIVLSVGLFGHSPEWHLDMAGKTKRMLDQLHFRKIEISDEILVINKEGYIGLSTCDEIHYAQALGIPIRYMEGR